MKHVAILLLPLAALASCASGGSAPSTWSVAPGPVIPPLAPEADEEQDEVPKNHVGLFLGVTDADGTSSGSIGIEYERRLSDLIGLGLLLELTPVLDERLVTAPSLFIHPVGGLFVTLSAGVVEEEGETHPLLRTGIGWEFELGGGFTIAPEVNYDLVSGSEDAVIYGLVFGYGF